MANERMDKLEDSVESLKNELRGLSLQIQQLIPKGKKQAHEEEYNGNEYKEGESSHSPHV